MQHSIYTDMILMVLGAAGLMLAAYIYGRKRKNRPLVCPLRANCELVTHSTYSKFLGIPVEVLGMIYYGAVVVMHGFVIVYPDLFNITTVRFSLLISTTAFLFSLYLISVQAFILKQWCTWCLCSALLCVSIFLVTYLAAPLGLF